MTSSEPFAPSRRGRRSEPTKPAPATPPAYNEAEVIQGTTTAILGALGRIQLKLDLLSREQSAALAMLETKVERLQSVLNSLVLRFDSDVDDVTAAETTPRA